MSDQRGLDIPQSNINGFKTGGHIEGIKKTRGGGMPRLRLAISINAADDSTRSALMPINKNFSLKALKEALRAFPLCKKAFFLSNMSCFQA